MANGNIKNHTNIEQFKAILKKHSLKATAQRLAVHEAMMQLGHASADMVTDAIRRNGKAKVTVASVYNILTQLALLGIYDYRMSANNKMYFDVNTFPHMHIYDRESHIYKDVIDDELIGIVEEKLRHRRFKGFRIEHIDIQLIGVSSKKKFLTA
jgi:Fe2+ or Zn2+ uptake regulation protein